MAVFNRLKSCSVDEIDDNLLEVRGIFIDTLHEISLTWQIKKDNLEIIQAKMNMARVPNAYCSEVQGRERYLIGIKIGPGARKAILNAVGNEHGCTHLADLAIDMAKSLHVSDNKIRERQLTKEEILNKYMHKYDSTCHHWTVMSKGKKAAVSDPK